MRAFLPLVAFALAVPAQGPVLAQSLEVVGYAGDLGEWELSANLAGQTESGNTE